jgi:catechol 2,3-dioxygenase-like lactoylglutathione lyase family enzyme
MIDHLGIAVRDINASKAFYRAALGPLGYAIVMEFEGAVGIGPPGRPQFWVASGAPTAPMHLAFEAKTRDAVEAFYKAAIEAGATDNGAPGLRPHYHSNYYGAFVIDLNGHNTEAVCHAPV